MEYDFDVAWQFYFRCFAILKSVLFYFFTDLKQRDEVTYVCISCFCNLQLSLFPLNKLFDFVKCNERLQMKLVDLKRSFADASFPKYSKPVFQPPSRTC